MSTIINNTGEKPLYEHSYSGTCIYLGMFKSKAYNKKYDFYYTKTDGGDFLITRWGYLFYEFELFSLAYAKEYKEINWSYLGECYRRAMAYLANPENPRP